LELEKTNQSGLAAAQRLILDQVESGRGVWQGDANALARVKGFASIAQLIEGCRQSWNWTH
jgi:hypothetical protein